MLPFKTNLWRDLRVLSPGISPARSRSFLRLLQDAPWHPLMQLLLMEGGASLWVVRVGHCWMPLSFFCRWSWQCVRSLSMRDVPPMVAHLHPTPTFFKHCLKQLGSEVFKMDTTFRQACYKPRLKVESCSVRANRTILLLMIFLIEFMNFYIRICMLFKVSVTLSNWDFFLTIDRDVACFVIKEQYILTSNFLPNHYFCLFPICFNIHFLLKNQPNKKNQPPKQQTLPHWHRKIYITLVSKSLI